eukprot:TRINITY_DN9740_c0_g1_i1.p1 TRINITY_DN9740_c0_g1~~TRINITY_DN9740_c0_g1_i1.p1  ORF type:complete len:653 (+),score=131.19 TRINITY_DN9740_c0_g1_i1:64-1959(+)
MDTWGDIIHDAHVTRELTIKRLESALQGNTLDETQIQDLLDLSFQFISMESWEAKKGGFHTVLVLLQNGHSSEAYVQRVKKAVRDEFENPEVRVRVTICDVLEALAQVEGTCIWEEFREQILDSIEKNFESQITAEVQNEDKQTHLMHDTEGWQSLETSMIALSKIVSGCGSLFEPYLSESLIELLMSALTHKNRFVRETGYNMITTLCENCSIDTVSKISDDIADNISKGLSDNWSQVRFAASVAVRAFGICMKDGFSKYHALLLPRMCLNRYYGAQGVRLYSLESWRQIAGLQGRELVVNFMPHFVEYYCKTCEADNHAVREAACNCIAELASKIDQEAVSPFVPRLLDSLYYCLKDASWPVRDAACVASADFIANFPDRARDQLMVFEELWFEHMGDNIWSVRENSAVAVGKSLVTYGEEIEEYILSKLEYLLPRVKEQPADSNLLSDYENTTVFGVAAKRRRDNDITVHTGQVAHSCGSLAPRLKKGTEHEDHSWLHKAEPWEETDGAVYLLRELSFISPDKCDKFLTILSDVVSVPGTFAHIHYMLETIWKQLAVIIENVGKDIIEKHFEAFKTPLYNALTCPNRLVINAASFTLEALRKTLTKEYVDSQFSEEEHTEINKGIARI